MGKSKISRAAAEMGRKGSRARMKKSTPAQRQAWARLGALATNAKKAAAKLLRAKELENSCPQPVK